MKIFISHASKDNEIAKKVVEYLESKAQVFWIDFEQIKDGNEIRKKINEGIENATHFLLLWSKNAYESEWVEREINGVSSKPYSDRTRMIIFDFDKTPLRPLDIDKLHRTISVESLESHIDDIIQLYSLDFKTQLAYHKKTVQKHYDEPPKFPEKPIISNFRKLEKGSKYYVRQKFKNLLTHQQGNDIFEYVNEAIEKYSEELKTKKNILEKIEKKNQEIKELGLSDLLIKKIEDARDTTGFNELEKSIYLESGLIKKNAETVHKKRMLEKEINREEAIKSRVSNSQRTLADIKKIRNQLSEFEIEKQELENLMPSKLSVDELTNRNSRLTELNEKSDTLQKILNSKFELEQRANTEVSNDLEKLDSIDDKKIDLEAINSEVRNFDESVLENAEKGNKILDQIDAYRKLNTSLHTLENRLSTVNLEKLIPIIGDYGSGKSSFSNHLINHLCKNSNEDFIPLFIPLGQLPKDEGCSEELLEDIFNFVKEEYKFNLSYDEFKKMLDEKNVVLILDALDEMSYKLDSSIGQKNLNNVIEIAKNNVVILTSRHTYLSGGMEKRLFEYPNLIKILDFDDAEIDGYLHRYLEGNQTEINNIKRFINSDATIHQLSRKPLFLNVIYSNFKKLQDYKIFNESAFLTILTDKWIQHDSKVQETPEDKKESLIRSRKEISKILAFAKKGVDEPIGINDIKTEVAEELGKVDPDAVDKLEEYYKDAVSSTFLIKEEDETYRFVVNPVREFFIARRIVDDINNNDPESILEHVKIISSNETFDFIKGIMDIEWAVKPHILSKSIEDLEKIQISSPEKEKLQKVKELLKNSENRSYVLVQTIEKIRDEKIRYNASNLLKILFLTGNIPKNADFRGLDFSNANIPNLNLSGCNLSNTNFSNSDLRGADFSETSLENSTLNSSELTGVNFSNADLTLTKIRNSNINNATFFESRLKNTDFTKSNLSHANFQHAEFSNTTLNHTDLTRAKIESVDFGSINVKGVILMGTDLSKIRLAHAYMDESDFRGTELAGLDLSNSKLRRVKFDGVDLTNTKFHSSDLSHAYMAGCILNHTDIDRTILTDVHNLPISSEEAVERGALL